MPDNAALDNVAADAAAAVERFNRSGSLDLRVDSATPERLTLIAYVDDPQRPRARLVFHRPAYVQLPWSFPAGILAAQPVAAVLSAYTPLPKWVLPAQSPRPELMPSIDYAELRDLAAEAFVLFRFVSTGTSPAEPDRLLVAATLNCDLS